MSVFCDQIVSGYPIAKQRGRYTRYEEFHWANTVKRIQFVIIKKE